MRKYLLYIILFLSLLANLIFAGRKLYFIASSGNNKDQPQKNNSDYRKELFRFSPYTTNEIIFLGNSITSEFLVTEYFRNSNVKNRGIWGDKTSDIIERLDECIESNPAKIFIMAGINDILRNIPDQQIIENFKTIVNKIIAESPGTIVYIHSILPVSTKASFDFLKNETVANQRVKYINSALKDLCEYQNLQYIDLNPLFSLNDELSSIYSWDGVHINGKGYELWHKQIYKFVVE